MSSLPPSPISATVDFDATGVQHGHLVLPYSRDDAAYGAVMIPIAVVANGEGPTVLLTGGNHGDEYQGPLSLLKLASIGTVADMVPLNTLENRAIVSLGLQQLNQGRHHPARGPQARVDLADVVEQGRGHHQPNHVETALGAKVGGQRLA